MYVNCTQLVSYDIKENESYATYTEVHCLLTSGPSMQTDVVISAAIISERVTFGAGTTADDIITISFSIVDDDVGLEAVETYVADLEIVAADGIVVDHIYNVTKISILDDDG